LTTQQSDAVLVVGDACGKLLALLLIVVDGSHASGALDLGLAGLATIFGSAVHLLDQTLAANEQRPVLGLIHPIINMRSEYRNHASHSWASFLILASMAGRVVLSCAAPR
jgi:hypothetical protein